MTDTFDCGGIDTSVTVGKGTGGTLIMLSVPTRVRHVPRTADEEVLTLRAWRLDAVHVAGPWVGISRRLDSKDGLRLGRGTDEWRRDDRGRLVLRDGNASQKQQCGDGDGCEHDDGLLGDELGVSWKR
jgi:hypothetical protein